jgi:hypothetical protein
MTNAARRATKIKKYTSGKSLNFKCYQRRINRRHCCSEREIGSQRITVYYVFIINVFEPTAESL